MFGQERTSFNDNLANHVRDVHINWVEIGIISLICVTGIIGNLISIILIIALKEYKSSTLHSYFLQLAIADLLFLLTIPLQIGEDLSDEWVHDEWICKVKETTIFLNYNASILFLMVMSIDRYIAVCHSFHTGLMKLREPFTSKMIIISIWIISILACIPVMTNSFVIGVKPHCKCTYTFPHDLTASEICLDTFEKLDDKLLNSCVLLMENSSALKKNYHCRPKVDERMDAKFNYTNLTEDKLSLHMSDIIPPQCKYTAYPQTWFNFIYINFVVMFLVPIFVMLMSYGLLIRRLNTTDSLYRKSKHEMKAMKKTKNNKSNNSGFDRSEQLKRKISIMCATLVLSFIICWLPFFAVHLAKIVGIRVPVSQAYICSNLAMIGSMFGHLNAAINPYLYNFTGTDYKLRMKKFVKIIRKKMGHEDQVISRSSVAKTTRFIVNKRPSTDMQTTVV